jgi:glycine/D-amino acid oxidase-like deaminating enzyme
MRPGPLHVGTPVWLARESLRRAPVYPSLAGRCEVDVAIVGGGMTGAGVAATFAEAGVRVAVLEGGRLGRGSTAASTALLLQEPDKGLLELGRLYGTRSARRIWELSHDAARSLVSTIRRLDIACDLVERDAVYFTTRSDTALRAEHERRRRLGVTAGTWLTPGPLRELTALPGRGAIRTTGNAQFNPYKACLGLLRAASRTGALVFEQSPVVRIDRTRHGVTVLTRRGAVLARSVVIATGYATPGFQPLAGRFSMHHTYVLATAPMDARQRRELGLGDVMVWDTDRPYHYARWTADWRLLFGGEDRPVTSGRRRAAAFVRATRDLRRHFESLLPALADIPIDHAWEGLFATTPDGLPYIGRHRWYPHHLFALGYGGNGMTFGFLAARLLLESLQGVESADHQLFGFSRI